MTIEDERNFAEFEATKRLIALFGTSLDPETKIGGVISY